MTQATDAAYDVYARCEYYLPVLRFYFRSINMGQALYHAKRDYSQEAVPGDFTESDFIACKPIVNAREQRVASSNYISRDGCT